MSREDYKSVLFDGGAIEVNGVSICDLSKVPHWQSIMPSAKWQVWSDKHSFNSLYHTVDEALGKFEELTCVN